MSLFWALCLVLLAGSISAFQEDLAVRDTESVSPTNLLQSYPSVVQIDFYLFWSTAQWSNECAGSIITTRFILSSGSCFIGWSYEPRFRRIRAGSTNRDQGGLIYYVENRINHPGRDQPHDYAGDVSVARLRTPLVYSPVIGPGTFASPGSFIPDNLVLNQLGFGRANQESLTSMRIYIAPVRFCGRRDGMVSPLNQTVNILCSLPFNATQSSNDDVGSPWFFGNITVGIAGGVNTVGAYHGILGAPVPTYIEWVINVVAGGF